MKRVAAWLAFGAALIGGGVVLGMVARSAMCAGPWICKPSLQAMNDELRRCLPSDARVYTENSLGSRIPDLGFTASVTESKALATCLVESYEREGWKPRASSWLNPQ